jgi:hypothetical protein
MQLVQASLTVMLDYRSGLGCILTSISVASSQNVTLHSHIGKMSNTYKVSGLERHLRVLSLTFLTN